MHTQVTLAQDTHGKSITELVWVGPKINIHSGKVTRRTKTKPCKRVCQAFVKSVIFAGWPFTSYLERGGSTSPGAAYCGHTWATEVSRQSSQAIKSAFFTHN